MAQEELLVPPLLFPGVITLVMAAVVYYDVTRMIIPNWLILIFLLLWPAMILTTPHEVDWVLALGTGMLTFAISAALFALPVTILGGGDLKLLTVCSIWIGWSLTLMQFLTTMAILGGILAIVLVIVLRPMALVVASMFKKKQVQIPRLLCTGEKMPYGVGIAPAFLIMLWTAKIPGLPVKLVMLEQLFLKSSEIVEKVPIPKF